LRSLATRFSDTTIVNPYPSFHDVNVDCSCIDNLSDVKDYPNYKFVKGNICSSELVSYVLETEKIDTIMHFAAQTHVDNSFGNSFQFTQNNILGTHVLLESAKVANIKRFIHVSTDEVYGEQRLDQEAMHEEQVRKEASPRRHHIANGRSTQLFN
jgi:UDP-glucose 4,6-dehydratase